MILAGRLTLATTVIAVVVLAAGCAAAEAEPAPTARPTEISGGDEASAVATPTAAPSLLPTSPATPVDGPVTFTYECWIESPSESNPRGTTAPFATWEEVWAVPTVSSCRAAKHGSVVTAEQEYAVDVAAAAYGGDRLQALEGLHVQCAITNNGYLHVGPLSGHQVDEVKGILALCPDRPGAQALRDALPTDG